MRHQRIAPLDAGARDDGGILFGVLDVIVVRDGIAAAQPLLAEQQRLDIETAEIVGAFGHLDGIAEIGLSDGVGQGAAGCLAVVAIPRVRAFLRDVAGALHVVVREGRGDAGERRYGEQLYGATGFHL